SAVEPQDSGPLRDRGWSECLLDDTQYLRASSLGNGHQPAELEARELHEPGTADRAKAEVAEEVGREDRLVHLESLVLGLALGLAVRERLERLRAPVACVADRGEEERLHDPRARALYQVRTCN